MASEPAPWSEDISKHNAAIDLEYHAEIEARKQLMATGEYRPRFVDIDAVSPGRFEEIQAGAKLEPGEINWHLELTAEPGRRVNVTCDPGVPVQSMTLEDIEQGRQIGNLTRLVKLEEGKARTVRALVGSRAQILASVGGNERLADAVEAAALKHFGVEDLDAPLPVKADA